MKKCRTPRPWRGCRQHDRSRNPLWKPIHQDYVKNGKKRSWSFYWVQFPSGADEKYDYVTVNSFDNFAQLEEPYTNLPEVVKKIHPNMKIEEFGEKTQSPRRLVREEMWMLIDRVE